MQSAIDEVNGKFALASIEDVKFEYANSDWRVNIIFHLGGADSPYKSILSMWNGGIGYGVSADGGTNWTALWNK